MEGMPPNLLHPPVGCRFHTRCPFVMDICQKKTPEFEPVNGGHFAACWLYHEIARNAEAKNG
jgi:oligopeptide/dipeptide ABC transporter ATP-binding protein